MRRYINFYRLNFKMNQTYEIGSTVVIFLIPLGIIGMEYLSRNEQSFLPFMIIPLIYSVILFTFVYTAISAQINTKQQIEFFNINRIFILKFRLLKFFIKSGLLIVLFILALLATGNVESTTMAPDELEMIESSTFYFPFIPLFLAYPFIRYSGDLFSRVSFESEHKGVRPVGFTKLNRKRLLISGVNGLIVILGFVSIIYNSWLSYVFVALLGLFSFICIRYYYDKVDKI